MTFSKCRVALLSALSLAALVSSLALPALPASATAHPAKAVRILNAGEVLCSGFLCLQTLSVTGPTGRPPCTAVVREWPYKVNLYGHLELAETFAGLIYNTPPPDHWWRGNIDGYNFTIPYSTGGYTYTGIAWQLNNPPNGHSYSNVGEVNFGISGPIGCLL
jgi:hypothetical protein